MGLVRIQQVSPEYLQCVIDQRVPKGCFLTMENGKWIAVDNTTSDAWTEEFNHKCQAIRWLQGEFEVDSVFSMSLPQSRANNKRPIQIEHLNFTEHRRTNMRDIIEKRAIKLPWNQVCEIVSDEIEKIIDIRISCKAKVSEDRFWGLVFEGYRLPLPKLCQILQDTNAAPEDWENDLPDEGGVDVKDISMNLMEKLISRNLKVDWGCRLVTDDDLWLVDVTNIEYPKQDNTDCIQHDLSDELTQAIKNLADCIRRKEKS